MKDAGIRKIKKEKATQYKITIQLKEKKNRKYWRKKEDKRDINKG